MAGSSPAMTTDILCCVSCYRNGTTALPRGPFRVELPLGHDTIAASLLGLIERAVASIDQILHGLARLELADPDRHRDAGQRLAGGAAGDLAFGERAADAFGGGRAGREIGAGENGDHLLAAVARRKIGVAHALAQYFRHQPQHLVADAVAEIVVEAFEVVDIDHERTERVIALHRFRLRAAEEFLERAAVGEAG